MTRLVLTAMIASAAVVAGCGEQKVVRAPCPQGKVCLEFGLGAEPESLDPHAIGASWEEQVVADMMVGLIDTAVDGSTIPGMATRWETSADGLTWTFYLRDAVWSDGVPVTADDFVFSLRRLLDPKTAAEYAALVYPVKNAKAVNEGKAPLEALGVRAVSPKIVEYTLEHPAPYLIELLQHQSLLPTPKHVVEKLGDAWAQPGNYVSNGAYTLVSWKIGDRVTLAKNPKYYQADSVCIDEVHYYPTEDRISGERQVLSGSLDTNTPILSNRVAYLRKQVPEWVHVTSALSTTYMVFNANNPKFKDVGVRNALAMTIDRDFLVNTVRNAGEPAAYTFVPPGIANYTRPAGPYWQNWSYEKRQAEAKRLLAAAGYGPNNPLKFQFMHRGYDNTGTYAAVQADWKAIGVYATLVGTETQIAYQQLQLHDFEVGEASWSADFNDAMNFLFLLRSDVGARNYGDYKNLEFDALLDKADNEPDAAKRAEYMRQAEEILVREQPLVPINYYIYSSITNPRLTGFVDNVSDDHRARFMCFKDVKR